jgi:Arc/MetJ-type ribon-helix-helix transcriptional regulator
MTITLTPEHERIIQAQLATGRFRSVEEVLEKVLAPLKSQASDEATIDEKGKARAAAERIRELRKGVTLERPQGMSLREYAHLGHRY